MRAGFLCKTMRTSLPAEVHVARQVEPEPSSFRYLTANWLNRLRSTAAHAAESAFNTAPVLPCGSLTFSNLADFCGARNGALFPHPPHLDFTGRTVRRGVRGGAWRWPVVSAYVRPLAMPTARLGPGGFVDVCADYERCSTRITGWMSLRCNDQENVDMRRRAVREHHLGPS